MCILLNRELATTSFILSLIQGINRLNKNDITKEYRLEDIQITPKTVMNYADLLHCSECGPIITNFNEESLIDLFNSQPALFLKKPATDKVYTLHLDAYINELPDQLAHNYISSVSHLFVRILLPYMNYPRSFLRYLKLCE